jgi:hypothetical protein
VDYKSGEGHGREVVGGSISETDARTQAGPTLMREEENNRKG